MRKLRVGVVGLGIGRVHLTGYQSHPNVEIAAVADPDAARRRDVGDEFGVRRRYETAEAMLAAEHLDIVSVCTPNKYHCPLTLAALEAGCHVLCEKPMAMNAGEARTMLGAAENAGRRIMIDFAFRFTQQSWALKQQVDTGILGDIYFARTVWHRRRGMPKFGGWFGRKALAGGGPLIDLGVHRLDLALWLMGYPKPVWVMGSTYDPIASARARKEKKKYDVEDLAVAFIRFANGATLELEASWAANIKERELMETRLLGTKAGLVQRNLNEAYEFEAEIYLERDGALYDMKLHPPVPAVQSPTHHFVDCILENRPHTATGEEGCTVMALLDAIYRSAETGAPVKIAEPESCYRES